MVIFCTWLTSLILTHILYLEVLFVLSYIFMSTVTIMTHTFKCLGEHKLYSCMISSVSSQHVLRIASPFTNSSATFNIWWYCSCCLETAVTIQSIFVALVVLHCAFHQTKINRKFSSSIPDAQRLQVLVWCPGSQSREDRGWNDRVDQPVMLHSQCLLAQGQCGRKREEVKFSLLEAATIFLCLLRQATVVKWGCNKEEPRERGTIWPNLDVIYGVNTDFSTACSPCGSWEVSGS